jgi:hypothetical protein
VALVTANRRQCLGQFKRFGGNYVFLHKEKQAFRKKIISQIIAWILKNFQQN